MNYKDAELIKKAILGDREAFNDLVRKYKDAVYGLAFHLVGNFADAQDITQQVFITVYMKIQQLKDHNKFIKWLNRITVNECVSWIRSQQSISRLHEHMELCRDSFLTPDQEFEKKEMFFAINDAMKSLSEKNRLVVTLYYIDGYSQNEIADFLGISASVVANRISRARKQLREETMKLIGDAFGSNKLPEDFIKKLQDIIEKGRSHMHKGNMGEALKHSDEALNTLSNLPESYDTIKLRRDALILKGESVHFPLGTEQMIKYHKQALELSKKMNDKREYAEALLIMAYDYADANQREKANEYTKKALKICEDMGFIDLQAEIMMSAANSKLISEGPDKALEYYNEAIRLFDKAGKMDLGSVCRAAISFINEVGKSPGIEKLIEFRMCADIIEKTPEGLLFLREPGYGECRLRTDYRWEEGFRVGLIHSIKNGQLIIDYSPKVGSKYMTEDFSFTFNPLIATRTIESDSDTVEIIAGRFDNCLRVKNVLKPAPDDNGYESNRELNSRFCGTKHIWFAPGIGPVKFIFDTDDGIHIHIELIEYNICEGERTDYFPLSVGNKWIYRWCDIDNRYTTKSYYEVVEEKGNIHYLVHYAYAYFSGSEDEYNSL